ncbi:MAG: tRNA (N(6)-L-threonylcarbamoyladenosine(37)-C(2))-methylthiotransferase MtaB [Syntrophobacteraceae bacterium]|nr:tRNA (N(6)-L-threonylcarbamoyladenosine(37)-C(2))-methylthiotransferase MtaB [Syntrophobacteraceae bacterium]
MEQENRGPAFAIETLGCKVNQYESSYFFEVLEQAGYRPVSFRERADIYIIHSCAVTAKAGAQTRQLLRRARRANPDARIVVAGCYAQLEADRIAREELATHILGNPDKFALIDWLNRPGSFERPCMAIEPASGAHPFPMADKARSGNGKPAGGPVGFEISPVSRMHTGRARAVVKIQDGCDCFCSYCVVPLVRGRSRSLAPAFVLAQLRDLLKAGYREIVVTGIHLGKWGKDLLPAQSLTDLLEEIASSSLRPPRLRLSSIEPEEFDSRLLELVSAAPWICRHFHIPLQSADPEILSRMGRSYSPGYYEDLVLRLHAAFPEAAIGADVIAGFPGESEKQFENTRKFIEKLPLSYLHVFPFSPRPGAAAAEFSDRVHPDAIKRRAALLQSLGRQKRRTFRQSLIGQRLEVLAQAEERPGLWEGISGNYVKVFFRPRKPLCHGEPVVVEVNGFRGEDLEGTVVAGE